MDTNGSAETSTPDGITTGRTTERRRLIGRGAAAIGAGLVGASLVDGRAQAASACVVAAGNTATASTTAVSMSGTVGAAIAGLATSSDGTVWGLAGASEAENGAGVAGTCQHPTGPTIGVWGRGLESPNATGVKGSAPNGVGGVFEGGRAAMRLEPSGPAPTTTTDEHRPGELYLDDRQHLWLCVAAGAPGSWRRLTAPSTVPVSPFRVYDSRRGDGPLTAGDSRVIDARDAIDIGTGSVTMTDAVPANATAVYANVTITATSAAGWIALTPGDALAATASTINWGSDGATIANGVLVALDDQRRIAAFAGGAPGASTDLIVDVTGYLA